MAILIIIAILVAIAYIFGKGSAQLIILGSGAFIIIAIVLFLVGLGLYYFWEPLAEFAVVIIICLAIGGLSFWIEELKKKNKHYTFNSFTEDHPYIYLIIFIGVIYLLYLGISHFTNSAEQSETAKTYETTDILNQSEIYRYSFKNETNIRTCGSFDCAVIGQYPANEILDFTAPIPNTLEWIELSWLDENGEIRYGYISRSTVSQTPVIISDIK